MSRAILKNTAWGLVGEMSARLSKIALMVLMARLLGAAEVGQFNFALAQAGLFTVFFDFGVSAIAVREMSRNPGSATFLLYGSVKLLGTLTGIVAVAVSALAFQIPAEERVLMMGLGLYLAFNDLSTFVFTAYRARNEFWRETMWRAIFSVLQLVACVAAMVMGYRVGGVVLALVLSTAVSLAPLIAEIVKHRRRLSSPARGSFLPAMCQCLPIAGTVLVGTLYMNLDVVVLGSYVSKEEIGWYSIAVKTIFSMLIMPLYYFQLATLPVFSAGMANSSEAEVRGHWLRGFVLSTTAGAVLILVTALGAELLLGLVFGAQFVAAAPILEAYGLIGFLYYLYTPLSQQLLLHGKQQLTLYIQIFALGINVALIFLCIPTFGVGGAVFAAGVTHALIALMHFLMVWRVAGFTRQDRGWWAIVRVSIGLAGAIGLIDICRSFELTAWPVSTAFFLLCTHRETPRLLKLAYGRTLGKPALEQLLHR